MKPTNQQLFLKNLKTIVDSHNKSYDDPQVRTEFICHNNTSEKGVDVYIKGKETFNHTDVAFVLDAMHTLCATSFFMKYDEKKKQCYLHVF